MRRFATVVLAVSLYASFRSVPAASAQVSLPLPAPPQAVLVHTRAELLTALKNATNTTIYVADDAVIDLTGLHDLPLNEGITLMSGRRGVKRGGLIYKNDFEGGRLFAVKGNNVRVRGLRMRGPSGLPDEKNDGVAAIAIRADRYRGLEVTDNEFYHWTHAGVAVRGNYGVDGQVFKRMYKTEARQIYVARNYMHHNVRDNLGYGVVVSGGSYATIEGNVFDYNRHAIASDGSPHTGYIARYNYVLEGGHCQDGWWFTCYYNQHFDVHGSEKDGYGGVGGEYFDISSNTFRGEQGFAGVKVRPVLMVRGDPTEGLYFRANVMVHEPGQDIDLNNGGLPLYEGFEHVFRGPNTYRTDLSKDIATGDFDGDGRQDVFLANGTAWFYSSGGITEWRFLRANTTRLSALRFGDFDGDGRTDVFTQSGTRWLYSPGGRRAWTPLAQIPIGFYPLASYRFGDFDGDGRTDLMRADGRYWYVSWSGRADWQILKKSGYQVDAIRLGDFDGNGATDVFSLTGGHWSWASGGSGPWTKLNDQLTTAVSGLVFADFDGNGRTDIAQRTDDGWRYARDGRGAWQSLRTFAADDEFKNLRAMLVANFDGRPGADALAWGPRNRFAIWSRPAGPAFIGRGPSMR